MKNKIIFHATTFLPNNNARITIQAAYFENEIILFDFLLVYL